MCLTRGGGDATVALVGGACTCTHSRQLGTQGGAADGGTAAAAPRCKTCIVARCAATCAAAINSNNTVKHVAAQHGVDARRRPSNCRTSAHVIRPRQRALASNPIVPRPPDSSLAHWPPRSATSLKGPAELHYHRRHHHHCCTALQCHADQATAGPGWAHLTRRCRRTIHTTTDCTLCC